MNSRTGGRPGCTSGARGPVGLVGRIHPATAGRAAGGRPGSRLLDVVGWVAVCCAGPYSWPHEPVAVDYHATEGRSWRLWLSANGARTARLPTSATAGGTGPDTADASARGTAAELILALYGRIPVGCLKLHGERRLFDLLLAWDPTE